MAEETVNIIDLDIDQAELLKKITKLQQEITDLKDDTKQLTTANKQLEKEGKKNTEQYKANSKQIEVNKVQTKGLSNQYRQNQTTLVALTGTENKQLGTLQKLEIQNKELRNETKSLDLTRKDGQKRLTQINKQLDTNNKFIAKNADATKKQKLNIGNYGSALQGLPGPLAGASRGVGILTTVFKALLANPIGLILAAIALAIKAIADAIKRNQGALDRFQQLGKGISAAYTALLDRINKVISAIRKLGKLNFKTIIDGFRGIGKEIREDFEAAVELTKALQELERQEIRDIVRKAELRKSIEKKRLASKDANITEQERLVLLQDAIKMEEDLLEIELAAAIERERIAIEEGEINKNLDEEDREIALAKENRINVEIASLKRRRTLASELKTVEIKAAKEAADIAGQEMLAAAKALDNEIQLEKIKSITINEIRDEDVEKQKARAEELKTINWDQTQAEIELARLVGNLKLDIAQQYLRGIASLFGAQTAIGKAAAVAETSINTYRAAQAAYAALAGIPIVGPGLGIAAAGAAVVAGLANVKKILLVKSGLPGDSGAAGATGLSAGTITTPRGTFQTGQVTRNGGITTQTLINETAQIVKEGLKAALLEAPPVLVVDDVTFKQGSQKAVSRVTTV